jgi:hypothetical protein
MRFAGVAISYTFLATVCLGVVTQETLSLQSPIRRISGRVVGFGAINPGVGVRLYELPELRSLSSTEMRQRKTETALAVTDARGRFEFRGIPKGSYAIEFSGRAGWNNLSVTVLLDPSGSRNQLCVAIGREGTRDKPYAEALPLCGNTD